MNRNCKHCGISFFSYKKVQTCCSRSCSNAYKKDLRQQAIEPNICEWCSKEYILLNLTPSKRKIQRFCSPKCVTKWNATQTEAHKKISEANKGKTPWNKGIPRTTEERVNISKSLRENGNLKGEKNPFYGKHHTEETKKKLSIASTEYCEEHGNSFKGKTHSTESKDQMSKSRVGWMISNGGDNANNKNYITGYYFSTKNQEELWHDSSYELRAYKLLDQLSVVKSYGRCDFSIRYLHEDGTTHRYIPDTLIKYTDGREEVIEIKPTTKLKEDLNVRKFKAGNKKYKDSSTRYVVWTEKKLKKLEEEMT